MTPALTYRDALEAARAEVQRLERELADARGFELALVQEMLEGGASYRQMAAELNVSASTVLRRYGAKGHANTPPSTLDLPAPRRAPKPGQARNGASPERHPAAPPTADSIEYDDRKDRR